MSYMLNIGGWSAVFAVPTELIDKHIRLCGANELKLILWILRNPGIPFDTAEVALKTGIPPECTEDALEYWVQAGLLQQNGEVLTPIMDNSLPQTSLFSTPEKATPEKAESAPVKEPSAPLIQKKMLRPDGIYIAKRLNETPGLFHVFQEAEGLLGRTISPSLSAVLINAHDDYNLPPEVITMLISFVASTGKTSTAYIETLVKNWHDSGVDSMAAAEAKITELSEKNLAWKKFTSATGLPFRSPSKKESESVYNWIYSMKFTTDMLRLCYERCVDGTGKFSTGYMNKIFETWYKNGISTVEMVQENDRKYKDTKSSQSTFNMSDFDSMNVFDLKY